MESEETTAELSQNKTMVPPGEKPSAKIAPMTATSSYARIWVTRCLRCAEIHFGRVPPNHTWGAEARSAPQPPEPSASE